MSFFGATSLLPNPLDPSGRKLFDRRVKLVVGPLEVSNLDCVFTVGKSLKPEPNTCNLKIYGLSETHRRQLETAKKVPVRLEAGYVRTLSQIYFGELRSAWSYTEGPENVTELSSGDGEQAAKARLHVQLGPKAPADYALRAIAGAMGVQPGNLTRAALALKQKGRALFPVGGVLSGNAFQNMNDFCRSADLEWSIQDGKLQILERGKATPDLAFVLSKGTGLIGSPSVAYEAKTGKQTVAAVSLLLPDIRPGRIVVFDSLSVKGGYRVEKVEYSGDRHGTEWYCKLECRKY